MTCRNGSRRPRRPARPSSCPRTCSTWRRRSARASASSIAASWWPPARSKSCGERVDQNASLEKRVPLDHRRRRRAGAGSVNRTGAAPLLHSTALLVRLRLRRLANQLTGGIAAEEEARRQDAHRKPRQEKQQGHSLPGRRRDDVRFRHDRGERDRQPSSRARCRGHVLGDGGIQRGAHRGCGVPAAGAVDVIVAAHDRIGRARQTRLGPRMAGHAANSLRHLVVGANPRAQRGQYLGRGRVAARVHPHRVVFRLSLDRTHRGIARRLAVAAARGAGADDARYRPAPHAAAGTAAQPARHHLRAVHRHDVSGDLDGPRRARPTSC